jgi:isochorismate hydrolase
VQLATQEPVEVAINEEPDNLVIKTSYFQPHQIQQTALAMLSRVERFQRIHFNHFRWREAALLILDMQVHFLEPDSHAFLPAAPAIIEPLCGLAETFAQHHRPIILTQHVNTPDDAGLMRVWWHDLLSKDHPYIELVDPFPSFPHHLIQKTQYDAFYQTPLEDLLHDLGINQVIIGGVVTHLCCETTARSAFVRGFEPFLLVDGTATYNLFFHQATLLNLNHGFASLTLCADLQRLFPSHQWGESP